MAISTTQVSRRKFHDNSFVFLLYWFDVIFMSDELFVFNLMYLFDYLKYHNLF